VPPLGLLCAVTGRAVHSGANEDDVTPEARAQRPRARVASLPSLGWR
jgi:hypothetical protein